MDDMLQCLPTSCMLCSSSLDYHNVLSMNFVLEPGPMASLLRTPQLANSVAVPLKRAILADSKLSCRNHANARSDNPRRLGLLALIAHLVARQGYLKMALRSRSSRK